MMALPAVVCPVLLTAMGAVGLQLRLSLTTSTITVAGAAAGCLYGLIGTAAGLLVAQSINTGLWLVYTLRQPGLGAVGLGATLARSATLAGVTTLVPAAMVATSGAAAPLWMPVAAAAAGSVVFIGASVVLRHPIATEWHRLAQHMVRRQT